MGYFKDFSNFMFGVSSNKIIKYTEKRAFQFILGMPLKKKKSLLKKKFRRMTIS